MSSLFHPPPADRELDEDLVRLTLGHQFPEVELGQVHLMGSGWEYDVYLINGRLVVRFPRYAEVAKDLGRTEAILDFVASQLPWGPSVPKIVLRGKPGPHFRHSFFGHHLIPGIPASEPTAPISPALAEDLGFALSEIHRVSPTQASRFELRPQKWDCRSSLEALVQAFAAVPAAAALVPEAGAWVRGSLELPPEYSGPARFLHDDFQPEHIIVETETGRLSGVIDWGPALGDPAQDFSFLTATWGWEFTKMVLEAYRGPIDPGFLPRLLFLGRVRALGWLAFEVQLGMDTSRTEGVIRDLLSVGSL